MKGEIGEDIKEMLGLYEICRSLVLIEALLHAREVILVGFTTKCLFHSNLCYVILLPLAG
jgi:hypothetical protein